MSNIQQSFVDVGLGKTASQSSVSPWTTELGAQGALIDTGDEFGFHTDREHNPWWQVDLGSAYPIQKIVLENRSNALFARNAEKICVKISSDGSSWKIVHVGHVVFGDGIFADPLSLPLGGQHWARFVRLEVDDDVYFHLKRVKILVSELEARLIEFRTTHGLTLPLPSEPGSTHPEVYELVPIGELEERRRVVALEINVNGAFGNSVIQYRNILAMAKRLGINDIIVAPGALIKDFERLVLGDIIAHRSRNTVPHSGFILRGYFFHVNSCLVDVIHSEMNKNMVRDYVRDLYGLKIKDAGELDGERVVGVHIRSGDIFSTWVHPDYPQPPLSFYKWVIDALRSKHPRFRLILVYEDRQNPTIQALEDFLKSESIAFTVQSGSLEDDLNKLLEATDLVFGVGTFGPAVTEFSNRVRSVYFFVPTNGKEFGRIGLSEQVVNVGLKDGGYIAVGDWRNNQEQRDLMLNFPVSEICIKSVR